MKIKIILGCIYLLSIPSFAGIPEQSFIIGKVESFDQQTVQLTTRHGRHIKIPRSAVKAQELAPGTIIQVNLRTRSPAKNKP